MGDGTSLLFDLDGFRVVSVVRSALGVRVVTIAGIADAQACPGCGVYSGRVHSRWTQAVIDLPYGRALQVRWDKRRFACIEPAGHLHRLANLMLTRVRQRVTLQVHGHRGRKTNDAWAYRQLLVRDGRALSTKVLPPPHRARWAGGRRRARRRRGRTHDGGWDHEDTDETTTPTGHGASNYGGSAMRDPDAGFHPTLQSHGDGVPGRRCRTTEGW